MGAHETLAGVCAQRLYCDTGDYSFPVVVGIRQSFRHMGMEELTRGYRSISAHSRLNTFTPPFSVLC